MKNLVVCCDGTWNTPTQKDRGRVVPSNVVKISRAVKEDKEQRIYYDAGIGTGEGTKGVSKLFDKITGGVFGLGITANIKQAYQWLAINYKEDDQIFLFGFSRGAYTVRSLAGMIQTAGLIPKEGESKLVDEAYKIYRKSQTEDGKKEAENFRNGASQRRPKIHFLGVWDTVGALGVPALSRYGLIRRTVRTLTKNSSLAHGFHSVELGKDVKNAFHALALDEHRGPFKPSLWEKGSDETEGQTVQQTWFVGDHCNIGGGYVDTGLSDHALLWMIFHAREAGLEFDEMYLSKRIDPNCHGERRDAYSIPYWFLPDGARTLFQNGTLNERIHHSVFQRLNHASNPHYQPRNLLDFCKTKDEKQLLELTTYEGRDWLDELRRRTYHDGKSIGGTRTRTTTTKTVSGMRTRADAVEPDAEKKTYKSQA